MEDENRRIKLFLKGVKQSFLESYRQRVTSQDAESGFLSREQAYLDAAIIASQRLSEGYSSVVDPTSVLEGSVTFFHNRAPEYFTRWMDSINGQIEQGVLGKGSLSQLLETAKKLNLYKPS